jgi:hypothetical protein
MSLNHIGGSLFPSNSTEILKPFPSPAGPLQVRTLVDEDTHGLFLGEVLLAKHPNGFSCHALGKLLLKGGNSKPQADYIVACGGSVTAAGWETVKTGLIARKG